MAAVDSLVADYNGKQNISFDSSIGQVVNGKQLPDNRGQCVQLVAFYVRDYLHVPVYYANAVNWYTDFDNSPLKSNFIKVANTGNERPQSGDIVIWDGNLPNSGKAGHIDVCIDNYSGGFTGFDTNWGGKYCHTVQHNYDYVLGWLRPNNNVIQPGKGAGEIEDNTFMDDEGAKELWRLGLHREPENDTVWRSWVGHKVEDGSVAFRSSTEWLTQNHVLLKAYPEAMTQLQANNALLAQLQAKANLSDNLQAQVNDLTAKNNACMVQVDTMTAQVTKDTETGNSFIRFIGRLFGSSK